MKLDGASKNSLSSTIEIESLATNDFNKLSSESEMHQIILEAAMPQSDSSSNLSDVVTDIVPDEPPSVKQQGQDERNEIDDHSNNVTLADTLDVNGEKLMPRNEDVNQTLQDEESLDDSDSENDEHEGDDDEGDINEDDEFKPEFEEPGTALSFTEFPLFLPG